MAETTLFSIACEMLQETNPFNRNISDLKCKIDDEEQSIIDIVEETFLSSSHRGGTRNHSKENFMQAYGLIDKAMCKFIENFYGTFSYRQKIKEKFKEWLKAIIEKYELFGVNIPDDLEVSPSERDTAIVMLKELHEREGVTKESLKSKLGFAGEYDYRSIQKNLRKLSPDLYEGTGMGREYEPFRIGGQPIRVKVKTRDGDDRRRYYWTPNTVHPIVLLQNLLQVETLLKALSLCNDEYHSNISTYIAVDIWAQLSEYAKEKLRSRFELEDEKHKNFIEDLDGYCEFPDYQIGSYLTQREMIDQIDATTADILRDAEKGATRRYSIRYRDETGTYRNLFGVKIKRRNQFDYIAVDNEGNEFLFKEEWLNAIKVE